MGLMLPDPRSGKIQLEFRSLQVHSVLASEVGCSEIRVEHTADFIDIRHLVRDGHFPIRFRREFGCYEEHDESSDSRLSQPKLFESSKYSGPRPPGILAMMQSLGPRQPETPWVPITSLQANVSPNRNKVTLRI